MELKQPVESDGDSKNKTNSVTSGTDLSQKSLRSDWEKTLSEKGNHRDSSRATQAGAFNLNKPLDKEIHLHIDAEEIHDGVELDHRPDPVWEPWKDKTQETPPQSVRTASKETEPVLEEQTMPQPQSLDPSLAAEALLHSQAVASITQEHAQVAPLPSYRSELPKEAQDIMDRLQPARDRHIEQSAWHNIEVDNKTGKAVEQPSFSYGEAFQAEQRTEANAFHTDDGVATASGQLAVSSPIFNNLNEEDAAMLSNTQARPTLPLAIPHSQIDFPTGPRRSSLDALLWTILTVIIFAIVLALLI